MLLNLHKLYRRRENETKMRAEGTFRLKANTENSSCGHTRSSGITILKGYEPLSLNKKMEKDVDIGKKEK